MYLDSSNGEGPGGGRQPDRVEIVDPALGVMVVVKGSKINEMGVCAVCCVDDATDGEILQKLNRTYRHPESPKDIWVKVVRDSDAGDYPELKPVCCQDSGRVHLACFADLSAL